MKAFVIRKPGFSELIDVEKPSPGPGEVLIRLRRVGFCGSDLNTFRGVNPLIRYPLIPGHEIGAIIEELAPDVPSPWQPGQEVSVLPYTSCGNCSSCRYGRTNACCYNQTLGIQRDGAMCEFLSVPHEKLIAWEDLSLRELTLVEPLTIGCHAVTRGNVSHTDTVAVLGAGMIGLGVVAAAAKSGAQVIAVDLDDQKLALARKCGADELVNTQSENLHEKLRDFTDGHGPDVIVEAIGLPATYRAAVEEVCFAGRVVYIGYAKSPVEYESKLFVLKELDIAGSRNALPSDFENVLRMLSAGVIPVEEIISHSVSIENAATVLKAWSNAPGEFTKIHVEF